MLFKKRSLIVAATLLALSGQVQAGPIGTAIATAVGGAASKVVNTLTDKFDEMVNGETFVKISNSTLENDVDIKKSLLFMSNVGISLNGRQVTLENATIKNDVKAARVIAAFTNLGISITGKEISVTGNSSIINSLEAEGAAILGGNAGIELGKG